jgi:hypothetical protein
MWLQEAPADTLSYMLLGFGVIFVSMGFYLASMVLRARGLRKDEEILDEITQR